MARFASAFVLTLSIVVVAPSRAAADEIWGEALLPGGAAAARAVFSLGANDGRFDAAWLVDLVRRNERSGDWSALASKLERYTRAMETIARAAERTPDGVRPPDAQGSPEDIRAFRDLADALGLDARASETGWQVAESSSSSARERTVWARALGLRADDIATRWNGGDVVKLDVPLARLPVPLPAYWRTGGRDADVPLARLVRDRPSALLYVGLMSLDDETLTWLDQHRAVIDRLRGHAPAFVAFARSLRIRDGVVDVPGGGDAANAWQSLVGQSPARADAFLGALVDEAGGSRLHFFDAVMYAPASTRGAIVRRAIAEPASLTATFQAFRAASAGWTLDKQPFARPLQDPAWALALVDLRGDSSTGPAWLSEVLARAAGRDAWPVAPRALPSKLPPVDVDWATRWLFERVDDVMARVRLLRFSRRLANLDAASPADVEIALRTFRDLPSLALTLERMGVREPALVARVGRAAYALGRSSDPARGAPILARWQMCLALIDQTARLRPIPRSDIDRLVTGLAEAAEQPLARVTGALIHWVTADALPALNPHASTNVLDTDVVVRAIAAGTASASTRVTWEGLAYDRNPLRVAVRDLDGLLSVGARVTSATTRALAAARARIDRGIRTTQDARDVAIEFDLVRSTLPTASSPATARFDRAFAAAARAIRALREDAITKIAILDIPEVSEAFGVVVDTIVQPIVYGLAMTPLHQPPALQADAWSFHQFVSPAATDNDWWRAAWQPAIAQVRAGGGSAMTGSWLLLDLALADAIVPRRFDQASLLAAAVREAMMHDVAVRAHASEAVSGAADAADRIARGRRVLAVWRRTPPDRASMRRALETAGVSRLRVNLASWTAVVDPARVEDGLTMTEIAGLGNADGGKPVPVTMEAVDGCICLAAAPSWPADDVRAYWQFGTMAAVADDLPLRLAEGAKVAGVEPIVVADLMPLAAGDWLARTDPYANDDWEALTLWPKRLDADAIDAYLMQLVSTGVLAPFEESVP